VLTCIIWKNDLVCKAKGLIFDEFKLRRMHREHAVATWNLGTISVLG